MHNFKIFFGLVGICFSSFQTYADESRAVALLASDTGAEVKLVETILLADFGKTSPTIYKSKSFTGPVRRSVLVEEAHAALAESDEARFEIRFSSLLNPDLTVFVSLTEEPDAALDSLVPLRDIRLDVQDAGGQIEMVTLKRIVHDGDIAFDDLIQMLDVDLAHARSLDPRNQNRMIVVFKSTQYPAGWSYAGEQNLWPVETLTNVSYEIRSSQNGTITDSSVEDLEKWNMGLAVKFKALNSK